MWNGRTIKGGESATEPLRMSLLLFWYCGLLSCSGQALFRNDILLLRPVEIMSFAFHVERAFLRGPARGDRISTLPLVL
jgi:hypothetical protein